MANEKTSSHKDTLRLETFSALPYQISSEPLHQSDSKEAMLVYASYKNRLFDERTDQRLVAYISWNICLGRPFICS